MKALTCFSAFLLLSTVLFAVGDSTQTVSKRFDFRIDREQQRLDYYDGDIDNKIELGDSALNIYARKVYLTLVDTIQSQIDNPKFTELKARNYNDQVYVQLMKVNTYSIYQVKRFDNQFKFMTGALQSIKQNRLLNFLNKNQAQSLNSLAFVKNESDLDTFLIMASRTHPDMVFANYSLFASKPFAKRVVEEGTKIAPVTVKRYFNPGNMIYETLKKSDDTAVKTIIAINEKFGRASNAFTLLDDIVNGVCTIEEANETGKDSRKYLKAMLRIRSKANPLALHSLETDLEIYSLKFVRVVNDLHNDPDAVRFASVENFTAEELYTLIVYSEEEIFTSTFNGLFKRLMVKISDRSGYDFIVNLGYNRFRTFIKMCAGFGKLEEFLATMNPLHKQILMVKFASELETYSDLSQAVEVADGFSSITDTLVLRILKGTIRYEYVKLSNKYDARGLVIYGLLSNLFVDRNTSGSNWFSSVSRQYDLPPFDRIKSEKLFGRDGVNRWMIYFYDDEDGDASFATFLKIFTDSKWSITDKESYVLIQSKGGIPVHIYANKPKHEYDGQEALEKLFDENKYEPNVMVHRGHSYYAPKTIEKIKDNTQIFVLGSCGGYNSISSIIDLSPEANIISSKQIGTMFVNNPMIRLLADNINSGRDVEWLSLWQNLENKVKGNSKAYERYLDYIPPHKNLGAIFIKTYNKMMEQVFY